MWLSTELLYYLFGLGLYEEEIVQDTAQLVTKMWLSTELLYYLFGLGLYEEEIVQDTACQKHLDQ